MTRVLAAGVFNLLHPGHIYFLEEARKLGDELVVIVSSDSIASKSKAMLLPQAQRASVVTALKPVDRVIIGDSRDIMKPVLEIRPDIIALGYDQNIDEGRLKRMLADAGISARIVRIGRLPGFSSSRIISEILSLDNR